MGLRYKDLEANEGILLAVVDAHCRYLSPARYDEEIAVSTSISMANRRIVEFKYEIRDPLAGRAIAHGGTKHIFLNREMRPVKLPEKYFAAFGIQ
jgi:acyl-CoA thioester hydrolase